MPGFGAEAPPSPGPFPHQKGMGAKDRDPARYGAIILAAGLSSRMGDNKVLLPWRDGQPIVAHVAAKFVSAGIADVIAVTGRDASDVSSALSEFNVTCVHNPDYATGEILSSVKVGLRALPAVIAATYIQPADMPCVPSDVIALLAQQHEAGWNLAPRCQGRRGHPVLLDRAYWRAMLDLPNRAMPRDALAESRLRLVDVEDEGVLLDVDTREGYEHLLKRELRDGGINLGHDANRLG